MHLKCSDGMLTIPTHSDAEMTRMFRGNAVTYQPNTTLEVSPETGSISVSPPPRYTIDPDEFAKYVGPATTPTVYLVSTITAQMIADSKLVAPANCRFMVPYSGPDPSRCYRVNGVIEWVAELIDYTP